MATTPAENRSGEAWTETTLRFVVAALVASCLLSSLIMLVSGSLLREPLSLARAFALAAVCGGVMLAIRWAIVRLRRVGDDLGMDLLLVAPSFVLLLLAIAVPTSQTSLAATLVFWFGLLLAELGWWFGLYPPNLRARSAMAPAETSVSDHSGRPAGEVPARVGATEQETAVLGRDVTQRMTRRESEAGESVLIEMREPFTAGQRRATVHAAFCPPLATSPEVNARQVAGPQAAINITQAEPFGVRLEIRLERAQEEATEVLLTCFASAAGENE